MALNRLVENLKATKDFADAVGSGRFDAQYKPLSNEDTLGKALLKMRDDLAENERLLEQKVKERTAEVVQKKKKLKSKTLKLVSFTKKLPTVLNMQKDFKKLFYLQTN